MPGPRRPEYPMIVEFGELDQQWALEAACKLETELFGAQAWDLQTLRHEAADTSRIYLADVVDVNDVGDDAESSDVIDTTDSADATEGNVRLVQKSIKPTQPVMDDEIMRGYVGMWHADGEAEILTIGVAKRFQRKGIAKNLLDRLIQYARLYDVRRIKLEVRVDNEPAKRLYRSRGFTDIGLLRHYYQPGGVDATQMVLDLETHIMGFGSEKQNMEHNQ
ncbi:ribosomal protein S18-alanine N-acetyltransferase [Bifidobacterium sp. ESL0728]|uniref:ribosomal protein S18-alanine N-acetyltransferase n=1 Tax=Bifidobacterium sp. ESL0728 TaxID=2983220 RepID=UPI0023FA45A5|nr:ribosomal protein S18-alanine N-acetyltransferase [Bifidobacterium sp. ESL0728]WEV58261.1 ribosomal protein S18-alanine N-acetyltransferase [Bifidobacterium sp. ESL0728]